MPFYVDTRKQDASRQISKTFQECLLLHPSKWSELVFLCIGSDRMTGDCLGPFVGDRLSQNPPPRACIYGTLSNPVHALNLSEVTDRLRRCHPDALVVAIDACLGTKKRLGCVTIGNGPLYPGAGVQKKLPPVGDIYITGTVNTAGILEQFTLQTTRLFTVLSLAEAISAGIIGAFTRTP